MFSSKKKVAVILAMVFLAITLSAYAHGENPVDLNGIWNDNGEEIKIVQSNQNIEDS